MRRADSLGAQGGPAILPRRTSDAAMIHPARAGRRTALRKRSSGRNVNVAGRLGAATPSAAAHPCAVLTYGPSPQLRFTVPLEDDRRLKQLGRTSVAKRPGLRLASLPA